MARPKKDICKSKAIHVRLEDDLYFRLHKAAHADRRTITEYVRLSIEDRLITQSPPANINPQ